MSMPVIKCTPVDESCALTAVIQSIALEEAALAHILNAEGEKIQKAVACGNSISELISINETVVATLQAIAAIDEALKDKAEIAINQLNEIRCHHCHKN